jgi:hypothetical protein
MMFTHRDFWLGPLLIAAVLALVIVPFLRGRLKAIYQNRLPETRRERQFLACLGFFVSVLVVRGMTIAIRHDVGPFHNVTMHGRHIHHLVWGILLLLLVGYSWLLEFGSGAPDTSRWAGRLTSLLFGVAAALTLDEFALWLNLKDVYWERQGRESYEAMGLFGSLLGLGVLGGPLFRGIAREFVRRVRGSSEQRVTSGR